MTSQTIEAVILSILLSRLQTDAVSVSRLSCHDSTIARSATSVSWATTITASLLITASEWQTIVFSCYSCKRCLFTQHLCSSSRFGVTKADQFWIWWQFWQLSWCWRTPKPIGGIPRHSLVRTWGSLKKSTGLKHSKTHPRRPLPQRESSTSTPGHQSSKISRSHFGCHFPAGCGHFRHARSVKLTSVVTSTLCQTSTAWRISFKWLERMYGEVQKVSRSLVAMQPTSLYLRNSG